MDFDNNPIESDHARLKARLRPMRGLSRFRSAEVIAGGHAFVQNLRRGHYELATDAPLRRSAWQQHSPSSRWRCDQRFLSTGRVPRHAGRNKAGLLAADGQDGRTTPVVVLGDLNDEPAAATTQILCPPGSQLDTPGFDHPDRGDGLRLWNLANRIPADQRFTRRFEGHGELIDHILVSQVDRHTPVATRSGHPA